MLRSTRQSIELVIELTKREIQAKYRGTYLGMAWAFLAPLLMATLFTLFFSHVFKARWEQFPSSFSYGIAIYAGLLVHGFVMDVLNRGLSCVMLHSHLVRKLVFPVQVLPVVVVTSATLQLLIGLFPLVVMNYWSGAVLSWHLLLMPMVIAPLIVLSLGLAWLGASLGVYFRDLGQAMPFLGNALLFLSPIFYARDALPDLFQPLMVVNPITLIAEAIRDIVMKQTAPDVSALSLYFLIALVLAGIGYGIFRRSKKDLSMCSERQTIVELVEVGKRYDIYQHPSDRLKQLIAPFTGSKQRYAREFWAIRSLSLDIGKGEVLGVIGVNGAGKSTLLQLITGVMIPSLGQITVKGRVAALLELGAGFNPEFTGRENIYLNASLLGLTRTEINERYDEIVSFAGLGAAIDQPVKTYSSGMYVRLGFSIATSVDPDVLIIDEALSVGDGAFARKSFDRIVGMKSRGTTVIFCSHSLFQVEAFCSRVLWLHEGRAMMLGKPAQVVCAYQEHLDLHLALSPGPSQAGQIHPVAFDTGNNVETSATSTTTTESGEKTKAATQPLEQAAARIEAIWSWINNDPPARHLALRSGIDHLHVRVSIRSNPHEPAPSLAFTLHANDGRTITSGANWLHALEINRDADGRAEVMFEIPRFPLLKGHYHLSVHLLCERGIHLIDAALSVCNLDVSQQTLEQGIVHVDQIWQSNMPRRHVTTTKE